MRAFGASAGALFLAIGRPDLRTKIQVAQLIVLAVAIYPLYSKYGVLGVAWAVSLYGLLSVYAAVLCFRACDVSVSEVRVPATQVAFATLIGGAAAWLTAYELSRWPLIALLTAAAVGGAGMIGVVYWLDRRGTGGFRLELEMILKALRGAPGTR